MTLFGNNFFIRWKSKCRKQEKEIERLKESMEQINMKNEEILKENIAGKTQTNNGGCDVIVEFEIMQIRI